MPGMQDIVNYTANVPIDGCKGNHDNASEYSATFPKNHPYPYPTSRGLMLAKRRPLLIVLRLMPMVIV